MAKCNCKCETCKTTIENLTLELESARKLAEDNLNLAKYQKAEFENYKKRNAMEAGIAAAEAKIDTVLRMFPILDSLEFGMKQITDQAAYDGLKKIFDAAEVVFASIGIKPIQANPGDSFDPHVHESMYGAGSIIEEELQKGYRTEKRVIRPSKVKLK